MFPPRANAAAVAVLAALAAGAAPAPAASASPFAAAEPPPPAVSASARPAFEAVRKALEAGDAAKGLAAADALLSAAAKADDPVGVAHGHQARALCLLSLNRAKEGLDAWQEAGDAWEKAGFGPGKLEAAGWVGVLVYGALPDEQAKIRQGLVKLAREEAKWPLTAAQVLNDIGGRFIEADERQAAEEILRAALELKQKHAPDSEILLTTLDLLGALARDRDDLAAAEDYLSRGLALREKFRPDSVEVAVALTALTGVAEDRGDLARAESLGRRAVAVAEKAAPDSAELADALTNLGGTLRLRGELQEAEAAHRRALALREKNPGPGSEPVAESLNNLGLVAEDRGDLAAAEDAHRKALAIFEQASPDSEAVARSLANLGLVLRARGDLAGADEASSRALALYQKHAPGSVYEAQVWNNLGTVSDARGALTEAEERFRRSLDIYAKAAPGSVDVVATLVNLGGLAETRGQYDEAEALLRRGLSLYEKVGPNSPRVALLWNNLGNVAFGRGDLTEAEARFRRALDVWEKSAPGSPDLAQGWVNLGNVARERGDLSVAEDLYRRGLAATEKAAPGSTRAAVPLANLALVLQDRGDLDGAGELVTRAVALYEKHASEATGLAAALNTRGNVAGLRGDYPAAEAAYRRALALCEKQAPGSRLVVVLLHNLARVALERGDLKAAEDLLNRALALSEQAAPDALDAVLLRNTLGTVAVKRGDLAAAEKLFDAAWQRVRREGLGLSGDESRQAFAGSYGHVPANLVLCRASLGRAEAALETLEQSRAQSLTRTLLDRRLLEAAATGGGAAWDAHQSAVRRRDGALIALDRAMLEVQKARQQAKDPKPVSEAEAWFAAAQAEYVRARADAEARWSELQKALAARDAAAPSSSPSVAALRAKLPEGALYAAFSVGEGTSLLFLVPAEAAQPIRVVRIEVPAEKLRAQVAALRKAASDPKVPAAEAGAAGRALFAALFPGEATRAAVLAAKRLIVSPDDFLWEVPFAALVTSGAGGGQPAYLGLATPLTYAPSLTVFAQGRAAPRGGGPVPAVQASAAALVVGDPAFGASVSGSAESRSYLYVDGKAPEPLPASRTEAREVAALYGATPLLGAQASEGGVRAALPAAGVVHLATHGVLRLTVPMASGLLLAPGAASGPSDDGAFQAWEVFGMRLNAGVAVLSACNTGRGRAQRGEGVVGLIRAWQVAGARSVVASLWPVADDSTARLMVALHRELKAGRPGDEALRAAMAAVQGDAKTGHPFWWAPFFVTGDPDATVPAGR